MPPRIQHKRNTSDNTPPQAAGLAEGEIAINTAAVSANIHFKDSTDSVRSVGADPTTTGNYVRNIGIAGEPGTWVPATSVVGDFLVNNADDTTTGQLTAEGGIVGDLTGDVTGDLTGDVTGNVSGSSGSCTGNAATATTATNCNRQVIAGNGLTGGGTLDANQTLNVGAGDGISVANNSVAVNSTVVRTSGNQTVGGTKTFSSAFIGVTGSYIRRSSTTPNQYIRFVCDSNGNWIVREGQALAMRPSAGYDARIWTAYSTSNDTFKNRFEINNNGQCIISNISGSPSGPSQNCYC